MFNQGFFKLPSGDERGVAPVTLVILAPIFLGMIILAFTASTSTQTDHNVSSAAQSAARSAAFCCDSAAEAAVVAHNIAFSVVIENSVPCRNFTDSSFTGPDIRVRFFGPLEAGVDPLDSTALQHAFIAGVDNPRSFSPEDLGEILRDGDGRDALRPGGVIQVAVFCELRIQDLTGLWQPFADATERVGVFNAVVDPFISVSQN